MRSKSPSQKGASAVEFAIVLLPLMVITFGIIEFGMFVYNQQMITNASREGARAGIVASSPRVPLTGTNSIEDVAKRHCKDYVVTFASVRPDPTVTATCRVPPSLTWTSCDPNATFGTELKVQVDYLYTFLVVPNFIQGPTITQLRNMQAVTVMRYE
jgi:Flp pilus assembly protein TadG